MAADERRAVRSRFAVVLFIAAASAGTGAQSSGRTSSPTLDFARLEAGLEALRDRWNVPGMAAGVARGNQIVWMKGFGHADLTTQDPVTPDTVFHLASLTKPFAAVILLQLVERGNWRGVKLVWHYGWDRANSSLIIKVPCEGCHLRAAGQLGGLEP